MSEKKVLVRFFAEPNNTDEDNLVGWRTYTEGAWAEMVKNIEFDSVTYSDDWPQVIYLSYSEDEYSDDPAYSFGDAAELLSHLSVTPVPTIPDEIAPFIVPDFGVFPTLDEYFPEKYESGMWRNAANGHFDSQAEYQARYGVAWSEREDAH